MNINATRWVDYQMQHDEDEEKTFEPPSDKPTSNMAMPTQPITSHKPQSPSLSYSQPSLQPSEELYEFNERLVVLEKAHDVCQLHKIYKAQVIAQEGFINKHPSMRGFYITIHSQLTGIFLGLFSLAGGLVEREKNRGSDLFASGLSTLVDFGALIPIPIVASLVPLLGKILTMPIQNYLDNKQSNRMRKSANIVFDLDTGKEAAKKTAMTLCELYEYQLKLLTEEGGEKLGRFACVKFLDFLKAGQLKTDMPLHEQFIMALQEHQRGIARKAKNQIVRQTEKWKPTREFFDFFGIDTEELPAHRLTEKPLYASELLSECGIRTHEGDYYASKENQAHIYGFRVGSRDNALNLGMEWNPNPSKDLMWEPMFPRINQHQEDRSSDEEIALDASEALIEAANRYTKAEVAGLAALAEAETAKSLILGMSANFVDLENRVGALEANIVIRRDGFASAFKRVQDGLLAFYSTKEKGLISLAFSVRTLDIKNSFVQLALVQEETQKKKEKGLRLQLKKEKHKEVEEGIRETLLEAYETIHAVKKPVELEALFDLKHPQKNTPCQKLLLLGRAGIGKSTLCQKITHMWATEGLWRDRFLYLFWIPLRNLTENRYPHGRHFLENILAGECFLPQSREEELHLIQDIREVLKNHSNQVLLILDGYDEATRMPRAIHSQLFERPDLPRHLMVTSRPYGTEAIKQKMDATLENMGFTDTHIEEYIFNYFGKDHREELVHFIRERRDLATMAHVPLLLEMLCILWEEKREKIAGLTMVELYSAMGDYGFERYFSRQKDCDALLQQKSPLKRQAEKYIEQTKLSSALGKIAFEGIKQGQLLIEGLLIKNILKELDVGIEEIYESGFLKATESNDKECKPSYFMHLSIQEYFAAFYLATGGSGVYREVMMTHKYHPYMPLIWAMCAGLLGNRRLGEKDYKEGCRRVGEFFAALYEEPRDLIGRYQNRLATACLNACADRENLYHQIEEQYKTVSCLQDVVKFFFTTRPGRLIRSLTGIPEYIGYETSTYSKDLKRGHERPRSTCERKNSGGAWQDQRSESGYTAH
ncbi:MAG: NACHT domain-containing protein [Waddliaceae bacterium]